MATASRLDASAAPRSAATAWLGVGLGVGLGLGLAAAPRVQRTVQRLPRHQVRDGRVEGEQQAHGALERAWWHRVGQEALDGIAGGGVRDGGGGGVARAWLGLGLGLGLGLEFAARAT